jgi:multiple sugar transport system substrate-binding protein
MKISKKVLAATLACLMLIGPFSGCSSTKSTSTNSTSSSTEPVTITFWYTFSDTEQKVLKEKVIPDYKKTHENVTIKCVKYPSDNFKKTLIQAVSSKSGPDIVRLDIQWVSQLASLGGLVQLDKMDGFSDVKSASLSAPMDSCLYNGNYYGLPYDTNTKIALYNTSDLKAAGLTSAPTTMSELLTAAKSLKSTHTDGLLGINGFSTWAMGPYFLSLGGQYCDKNYTKATGYLNSTKSIEALQTLVDAYDDGLIGKCVINGKPGCWDGLKASTNSYLMCDDGPWFYTYQDETITSKDTAALIPSGDGGSVSIVGGEDLVMTNCSKNQQAAWEFMKYLSTSEYPQTTMATDADCLPTCKAVAESSAITSDATKQIYMKQLETAWARIPSQHFNEMDDDIIAGFEKAFRHKCTVKEALDALAAQLDPLFGSTAAYSESSAS